jgi:hypothetical protein
MADITHPYEGALADLEIYELIKLVTTPFSDIPPGTETVQKMQRGHIVGRTSSGPIPHDLALYICTIQNNSY